MGFKPNEITKEHVLSAVSKIDKDKIELIPSTRWVVLINEKEYPPKEVMRYAHSEMNGEHIWNYSGGKQTNNFLIKFGFEVVDNNNDPIKSLIDRYKEHIKTNGLKGEVYKWKLLKEFKGRPNLTVADFQKELKSINYANLIYGVGYAAIYHLAKDKQEDYLNCFDYLFNENIALQDRVLYFHNETLKIYREIVPEEKYSHHQDERTISTFLTFHDPDKYTLFKDSFYSKLCKLLKVKPKPKCYKYTHYLSIIQDIIEDYILTDDELLELKSQNLPGDVFADTNHLIFAQDILYQTLDGQVGIPNKYWRIGTTDGDKDYWSYMKENNVVCVGWPETGDLRDYDISSKKSIEQIFKDEGYYPNDKRTSSRKAGELFNFYDQINIGDIVLAQNGHNVLGIGVVLDEYYFDDTIDFPHQIGINWLVDNPHLRNPQGNQTTVYKIDNPEIINNVNQLINQADLRKEERIKEMQNKNSLNQILYGPPGTGKTYNTINKALEICGVDMSGMSREDIKSKYDDFVKEGRIMFTTFHQSMSYEDFIEGIKPILESDKEANSKSIVEYEIIPGIFKEICSKASEKSNISFLTAYQTFKDSILENDNELLELKTDKRNKSFYVNVNSKGSLNVYTTEEKKKQGVMTKENLQKLYEGDNQFIGWEGYAQKVVETITANSNVSSQQIEDNTTKPFVLIIDEINRGNIAAIFGELITLIEESKRQGEKEQLKAILPYSKDSFTVPNNLYIIGTMNTADRSVEALDAALRRRFSFIEMPPQYDIKELNYDIVDFKAFEILKKINQRIEKLLDKDHMIGHSYFLKNGADDMLPIIMEAFYKNIIPLLQEYFFGDYGKIGLVLGKGFVEKNENSNDVFADFDHESSSQFEDREVYSIIDYRSNNNNEGFKKAIMQLMNKQIG